MVKILDLFKIHTKGDFPSGWVWVRMEAGVIQKLYFELLNLYTQRDLTKRICTNLKAGFSTVEKHLIQIKKARYHLDIPLPIIIELYHISGAYSQDSIQRSFEFFYSVNYKDKSVLPVLNMNETVAKIIGAHAADGYLQQYKGSCAWKVTEGKEDLVSALSKWIQQEFGFLPNVKYSAKDNMWICYTKNKVFCRFLKEVIGLPVGKKAYTIREPEIIAASSLNVRAAFVAGIMNFDGCVKTNGIVSLTSMSKKLIQSVNEIFKINRIVTNIYHNKVKGSYLLESKESRNPKLAWILLSFFEPQTHKYQRLKFFTNNDPHYTIDELCALFPRENRGKTSLREVYDAIVKLRYFSASELATECCVAVTTIYKYLHILEKGSIIYKEKTFVRTSKNMYTEVLYHFTDIYSNDIKKRGYT